MLLMRRRLFVAAAAVLALAATHSFGAEQRPSIVTAVTIEGEMCGGCVKKIKAALADVPGIAEVTGDTKAKTITIVPAPAVDLSPRVLWEAIEKAGKNPVTLVGPHGTFKSKPKG
ncbi:MAG: heavy-metal-associated domain-containing protein [Pirellulales bacterium]